MGAHCDWMSDHGHSHGIGLDVARVHSHGGSGQFLLHRSRDHFLPSMEGSLGDHLVENLILFNLIALLLG